MTEDDAKREAEAGARSDPLSLLVISSSGVYSYPLKRPSEVVLGRSDEADVPIHDPRASRRHVVVRVGSAVEVVDLGSTNGTRVREERIAPTTPVKLGIGDAIGIGETLIVLQRGAPEAALPDEDEEEPPSVRAAVGAMARVWPLVDRVAPGMIPVLLVGEDGVGKEVMARTIHERSPRAAGPMVSVSCAALDEPLLESELFGHERGASSIATTTKRGVFEAASGGTLLLDEVDEMPLALQERLLRVMEQREVLRVGAARPRRVDVRVLSATNRDLSREVEEGRFRADLYLRLNGFTITIPPLRERVEEIDLLARAFVAHACESPPRPPPRIASDAMALLKRLRWPGNLRELRSAMERAVTLCAGDVILPEHLPSLSGDGPAPMGIPTKRTKHQDRPTVPWLDETIQASRTRRRDGV